MVALDCKAKCAAASAKFSADQRPNQTNPASRTFIHAFIHSERTLVDFASTLTTAATALMFLQTHIARTTSKTVSALLGADCNHAQATTTTTSMHKT